MSVPTIEERQAALKELLFRIVDDLEQAGVPCFGVYGTALGAARHGDIIPWDDDADLTVLSEDLSRAFEVLRADPDLFVWDWFDDPMDPTPLPKVLWRFDPADDRAHREAEVDLFVLFPEPVGRWQKRLRACAMVAVRLMLFSKLPAPAAMRAARRRYAPVRWFAALLALPWPVMWLKRFHDWLAVSKRTTGDLWCPCDFPIPLIMMTFRRRDFEKPVRLPFGDRELAVPGNTDEYLRDLFGDWRTPPPPEDRERHSWDDDGHPLALFPEDEIRRRR